MINGELIVDNFAGGGGASTGIELISFQKSVNGNVDIAMDQQSVHRRNRETLLPVVMIRSHL